MKIVNPWNEDFHMHSLNFSDGIHTVDEIVKYAWEIGLSKIAITDHSQFCLDVGGLAKKGLRKITARWKNVHNAVEVKFWVECDIKDDEWNVCRDIQWVESDFSILSLHKSIFTGNIKNVTQVITTCIKKHHDKIQFLCHPCKKWTSEFLDIEALVKVANEYKVPLEFNCANLVNWKTDLEKEKIMLSLADQVYVNSDAHTLWELKNVRQEGFEWLKENKFF